MTNYDILEALNSVDDECIKNAKTVTVKKSEKIRTSGLKPGAMAACFCLLFAIFIVAEYQIRNGSDQAETTAHGTSSNNFYSQFTLEQGIYVCGKLYMPDAELSEKATGENIGAVMGYMSFDNKTALDIYAFEYVPNDEKTNRVIVSVNDSYYVYSFYSYMLNDNKSRIVDLLGKTDYVEIRNVNYEAANETVYLKLSDPNAMIGFLSLLDEPRTRNELNRYYFDKFKDRFKEGEIWISDNGGIANGGNPTVSNRFNDLVNGRSRIIVAVMKNGTYLTYHYFECAGVIRLEDSGYGYILTEEQVEKINHLIGLT